MCFVVLSLSHPHSITLRTPEKVQCTVLALCQEELILLSLLSFYSSVLLFYFKDGPTETSIWSTSYTLPKDPKMLVMHNGVPVIPVGLPISEVQTHPPTHPHMRSFYHPMPCYAMPCHVIYTVLCRRPSCY